MILDTDAINPTLTNLEITMINQQNSNLKKSLIALIATASIGGISLGFASEARSAFSPNENTAVSQSQETLLAQTSGNLKAIGMSGIPDGFSERQWMNAQGDVMITDISDDSYTLKVEASGLVPHGLYTVWWMKEEGGSNTAGPAGGLPYNDVRADRNGNVMTVIEVPMDNDYQMMAMAYHSDNQTHGYHPGENGVNSFGHLMGEFIKPNN